MNWNADPFSNRARNENYLARSVYKLEEIDRREKIIESSRTIIDLGASPGSWCQYCVSKAPHAKIYAVDIEPMRFFHPNVMFIQSSIESLIDKPELLPQNADLILSDMAPKTSGVHDHDVALSTQLVEQALTLAKLRLRRMGSLVVKLFMGITFDQVLLELKTLFLKVRVLRPEATRKRSREVYFVGRDFFPIPHR